MKNVFCSFLHENSKKLYMQEFLYNIITNDQKMSLLFLQENDPKLLKKLLQTILNQMPISTETLDVRWTIQLIFNFLNQQSEDDMSYEIALNDFLSLNDQAVNEIKKYINYNGEINNRIAHNLSFFIQLFLDEYPGIFYSILPSIQKVLSQIGYDRLFKEIGTNFIPFCVDPPLNFFRELKEIDEQEISTFFQFHTNFTHIEFTFSLQKKVSNLFFYPKKIKGLEKSSYFTLTNSSLCKNEHFIDTIVDIANYSFINHANTEMIQKASKPILDILPYIIIANQSFIYSDYNQYSSLLANKQLFQQDSIATNLIERFQNDFRLLNFLSNQTGDEFCSGDLLINSFPFFLESVLQDTDNILKLSNLRFFSITDKSADNDFNFVRSYGAFHLFFSLFNKNQMQIPLHFQLTNIINQISKLLCSISNAGIQSMVIVDLFSCIFIQDEKGQFLCHPFIAQQVIQVLAKFDITPYISGANALFERKRASRTDTSISAWFNNNDISLIYKEIRKKNWQNAEKLTMYLPYYRRLCKQAMNAELYLSNNEYSSSVKLPIKINVLLSIQTDVEKLREIQKKSGIFDLARIIIEKRLSSAADEMSLLSPFENKNNWQPTIEFSINFDQSIEDSLKKVKKYHEDHVIISISKSLDEFLQYLYKYYRCAILIDSTTFDSIEDLFSFNFYEAIEGAILQDRFEWASELTKYIKKDLFSFVFENISFFIINENFINNICHKTPIEATALSITSHVKADLPKNVEKIVDYFESLKSKDINEKAINNKNELFNSIFNDDFDEIDDIIFAVDHNELFDFMMNKFDNETIASQHYTIFNYISYVSTYKYELRVKQIEILYKIHQVTKKLNPSEIVSDVKRMNNGDQYFDLLIDYLYYCTSEKELTIPLCTLFTLSLSNDQQIDKIIKNFPDRFHIFLSHFFHVKGILSHLLKYAPKSKLQFLKSISMLPEKVFIDSNIFDADTIADSYIRYDSEILEMPKEVSLLFKDEQLFTILKGTINSIYCSKIFYHLFQFFEDKEKFIEFWADSIDDKLKSIVINTEIKENECLEFFNSLKEPFNSIEHIKFVQFKSLSKLVETRPFLKYRIPYSFQNFGEPSFLKEMLSICNKTDNVEIMIEISKSFEIDLDSFFLSRARIQLIFGDFNGSIQTIQQHNLKIDKYSNPFFYDSTYDFLIPVTKCPIVNHEIIKENTIENPNLIPLNVFQNISLIITKNKDFIRPSFAALELMKFLLSIHCNIPQSMSLFVAFSYFEEAFKVLENISDKNEQIKMFINYIYFPVIYNNLESSFNDFIASYDKKFEKTEFLWNGVIEFFTKNKMEYGIMNVFQLENKLEDAAIIGFDIFKKCNSFYLEISVLGNIIFYLKSSINFRKTFFHQDEEEEEATTEKSINENNEILKRSSNMNLKSNKKETEKIREGKSFSFVPVAINETKTFDEILKYYKIAELQLKVCQFFIEQNATFSNDYDITSSDEKATYVSAQLILNHDYEMMKEIKEAKKLSLMNILLKVCDLLNNESFDSVKEFMKSLPKEKAYVMLQAFSMSSDRQNVLLLICECFERSEQCFLFLEYNFIAESFALAIEFKNKEIIPLIGHNAAILGDCDVVDQCNRILNIL